MTALTRHDAPARSGAAYSPWLWVGTVVTALSGVLHVLAAVDHAPVNARAAVAFVLTAAAQFCMAGWIAALPHRPALARPVLIAGAIAVTVAFIAAFVLAYTSDALAGLLGHASGHGATAAQGQWTTDIAGHILVGGNAPGLREGPTLLGGVTVTLEVFTLLSLVALLPAAWRRTAVDLILGLGGLIWILWIQGVLR